VNAARRKQIEEVKARIEALTALRDELVEAINTISEDEQNYLDNMPDSFRDGDKGDKAQEAIDALSEATTALEEIDFDAVIGHLEAAAQ